MKPDRLTVLLLVLVAITLFLWAWDKQFAFNSNSLISYLGQIAGLLSILCMSLDYITSTRIKIIEDFAGGLDIVYRFHGYIGKWAGMIIIGHPLFLIISRFTGLETIQRYLIPGNTEFFNWGILSFWILILSVVLTVFVKMDYRLWKFIHRGMIVTFAFGAYHVYLDYTNPQRSPGISLKESWIFFFIIAGLISFIYRDSIYPFLAKKFKVVKVNTFGLITEIYLDFTNKAFKFSPGQYVFMSIMNNPKISSEAHPFTITSSPNDHTVRVSAKHLGDYTKKLVEVKPGDLVKLWGPYGEFTTKKFSKFKNQIWIAGGIGIASFLSMAKYAIETNSNKTINLFYVEKNDSECEYNKELYELSSNQNIVKIHHHYDQDNGYITAKLIKEKVGDLTDQLVLICGPEKMEQALRKQFIELGLKNDQIKSEDFAMRK